MDITPMIDVVFQLVLFFVVTTDFAHRQEDERGLQIDLPRAAAQALPDDDRDVSVWMSTDGGLYVEEVPATLDELRAALRARADVDPDTLVVLRADLGVAHGRVVEVMDLARGEGLTRLAIATDPSAPRAPAHAP